ncbi:MAG: methyl-accepting protein, partial [Myxococcaceae bacterium]
MPRRLKKPGLRGILLGSFGLALAVILGTLYFVVPRQVGNHLRERMALHAQTKAEEVSALVQRQAGTQPVPNLGDLPRDDDFSVIAVLDAQGVPRATSPATAPSWFTRDLEKRFQQRPLPPLDQMEFEDDNWAVTRPVTLAGGVPGEVVVVVDAARLEGVLTALRHTV